MSYLRDEISEQPAVFARLLHESGEQVRTAARRIADRAPSLVVFVARGSSDNAATYGRYLVETSLGVPVSSAAPSITGLYRRPPRLADALVVGISQSGQSPDVVGVLDDARRQGALTLAISNDAAAPLASAAELLIEQRSGPERSVAATKTYTTQLVCIALLVAALGQDPVLIEGLGRLPAAARAALCLEGAVARIAHALADQPACLMLARGFNYATALELALKLKELAYVFAEPYSGADFLHGPAALATRELPAVLVGVEGPTQPGLLELSQRLIGAGVRVHTLSDDPALLEAGRAWPSASLADALAGVPEALSPPIAIVPGQLLALHLAARRRGDDLDQPRGLSKVTRTS
jgi:glucosamine--fructose-6-phosphate aminotransferase (isomerizing)